MKTIKQSYLVNASVEKVWQALVDPKMIEGWGARPAVMSEEEGKEFSLWGGDIHGKNVKVAPQKELVQEWYGGDWEKPSLATFNLRSKDGKTQIDLLHEDVPDSEADDIDNGWKRYYLGPMKEYLENNSK